MPTPPEILNHIFGYVMIDILDEEMIRKVCALRESSSDFVRIIAENVKQLNVGSLLIKYERGNKLIENSSHLSKNIEKIVHIFPKLERLNLDGLIDLRDGQLEMLLNCFEDLKEISLVGCRLITQFNGRDISQFESVTVSQENVSLRADLYSKMALAVYDRKQPTLVKVPNSIHCFLKSPLTNLVIELDLCPQDTIQDVKILYEGKTGICPGHQRMIFAGKRLEDNRTLSEYGCTQSGSTIHVVMRLSDKKSDNKVYQRPNYNLVEFKSEQELTTTLLYEHDEFRVLELNLLNESTCALFTKDILYEKQDDRHDYNLTSHLLHPFKKYLNTVLIPYLNKLRTFSSGRKIQQVQDIFVVHYSPEEDQDLVLHIDPSYITLNICVHLSDNFSGNEIEFVTQQEKQASEMVSECGCGSELDETQFTYQRITPAVGKALIHMGSHPHKTLKIVNGKRFNVVCWLK